MRSLPRFRVGQRISAVDLPSAEATIPAMGFNRRKMEDQRRDAAEKEAASRRVTMPKCLKMPSA
jgi:hypothetical protein